MQQLIAQFLFCWVVQTSFFEILKNVSLAHSIRSPLREQNRQADIEPEKHKFVFFEAVRIFGLWWWCQLDFERFSNICLRPIQSGPHCESGTTRLTSSLKTDELFDFLGVTTQF